MQLIFLSARIALNMILSIYQTNNEEQKMKKKNHLYLVTIAALSVLLGLTACGGGQADTPVSLQAVQQEKGAELENLTALTNNQRKTAVQNTIASNAFCSVGNVGDFYWEIGNGSSVLASGQRGSSWDASSQMNIASASKWVAGAFVVQKLNPTLANPMSAAQINGLRMHAGYISQNDQANECINPSYSLQACASSGANSTLTPDAVGKFRYGSGHAQQLLLSMGYGPYTAGITNVATFGPEVRNTLGMSPSTANDFNYVVPIVSGGMRATPTEYGKFLRKMVTSSAPIKLKALLGSHAVCTNKNGNCASAALYSPVPENWQYSLHHWVELDGTYSSPGRNGFYPWIDSNKQYYGMLARQASDPTSPAPATTADYVYWKSVECGRKIRQAWLTGAVQ
jgi:hypothetical protein